MLTTKVYIVGERWVIGLVRRTGSEGQREEQYELGTGVFDCNHGSMCEVAKIDVFGQISKSFRRNRDWGDVRVVNAYLQITKSGFIDEKWTSEVLIYDKRNTYIL